MNGENLLVLYQSFLESEGVFTDTRKPVKGGLFFALSGPNFNGNQYADDALKLGATKVVIDDAVYKKDDRYILVGNTLNALQSLANHHRSNFKGPVIGLTGSNGKTTTKELITEVLSTKYAVISTIGNLNNHIGVPLTLLRINTETEIAVIEMGANHVGEIESLCAIAEPTHGFITNIGRAHIEGFGSVEGIKRGKGELYNFLFQTDGVLFLNTMDTTLVEMADKFSKPITYPKEGDFSYIKFCEAQPFIAFQDSRGLKIKTQLIGDYNFANVATAFCIGQFFEVPVDEIERAISEYVPSLNRSQVVKKGSNTILLDAYNANPDSMQAALTALEKMDNPNKVVILGDMLELGDTSTVEHQQLGITVNDMQLSSALFCGELVKNASEKAPQSNYFEHKSKLEEYLSQNPITDSVVLIKASRGIGLETLLEVF